MDLNPRDPSSSLPKQPSTPNIPPSAPQIDEIDAAASKAATARPTGPVVSQPVATEPEATAETTDDSEAAVSPATLPGDPVTPEEEPGSGSESEPEPASTPTPKPDPAAAYPDVSGDTVKDVKTDDKAEVKAEDKPAEDAPKIPDSSKAIPQGIEETHDHEHHREHHEAHAGNAAAGDVQHESHSPAKTKLLVTLAILILLLGVGGGVFGMLMTKNKSGDNSSGEPAKLKVGVMMAFSGGSSSMGYGAMKGINMAKKQLNATNIEIVQMDSKCDPKSAAAAIKQLIAEKVVAIIGEGCSSATVAALPAANNAKVVMISPSASSPTLSIPNDYFFRVVPADTLQGSFMAQYIYNKGIRNVAAFYTDEPYGSGMNQVFREKFEALGGKIVATASAEPDVIDLPAQVKTIKDAKPQAIFIAPNSVVSATAIIKLLRSASVTAPLYGADIMYDTTIIQNGGAAAEGLTISSFPTGTKSFKQALTNENKKTEQLYAAPQAYDIINVLKLAAEKGATTGEEIKNILPSISFDGVSGPIAFDRNGEISNKDYKYDLFQVKSGEFVVQE